MEVYRLRESAADIEWPDIVSAKQLVDDKTILPPPEIIAGVLHKGCMMMLSGSPKTNKTFCLLDLALSVAAGERWWEINTSQGNVLYVDLELKPAFLRSRLKAISEKKAADAAFAGQTHHIDHARVQTMKTLYDNALGNIDILALKGTITGYNALTEKLISLGKEKAYNLIIIDPLYKLNANGEENEAGNITKVTNALEQLATKADAAVVYAHHFSKGNQAGKESIDRASGSGVFARAPDAIVTVTRHDNNDDTYSVEFNLRNCSRKEPFVVEWKFPMMVPNRDLNPSDLKRPGKKTETCTPEMLLGELGEDELTPKEWEKRVCEDKKLMKPRTFYVKFAKLKAEDPCRIVQTMAGKWKRSEECKNQ